MINGELSDNKHESDGSSTLGKFLTRATSIHTLRLANSFLQFNQLSNTSQLKLLDISGHKLDKKSNSDLIKFLNSLSALTVCEFMPHCKINEFLQELNLSKVNPPPGILPDLLTKLMMPKLASLDVSDNDLSDEDLHPILAALMNYDSLTSLSIGGNFVLGKYNPPPPPLMNLIHYLGLR